MILNLALIVGGIALLGFAGDRLVEFAAEIARRAKLTPAVIGLTIVAAGTSLPELFVSITAAFQGSPDIAVGNVVGSNTANVALVLGACALVTPLTIHRKLATFEYPVMLLASWIALLLFRDGVLDQLECGFFLSSLIAFTAYSVWVARKEITAAEREEITEAVTEEITGLAKWNIWTLLFATLVSFVALAAGSRLLVTGAINIAAAIGISERVIGLTVVAVGTSLPELVASLMASFKKQHDMAIANILGSNMFNLLMILGATGIIRPIPISQGIINVDVWVMMGAAVLLLPVVLNGGKLGRTSGIIMLLYYAGYTAFLAWKG